MNKIFEDLTHLNTQKRFNLTPWMEITGELQGISKDDHCIYVGIDDKVLVFQKDSDEALHIQEKLNDGLIGRFISILRTDILEKPILILLNSKRS